MKLSALSIAWAVIYLAFGLGLLIIPHQFMTIYGVTLTREGAFMTRILGSSLTAFGLIYYFNRNQPMSDRAQRNLVLGSFIYNLVDLPVVVRGELNGTMNTLGWVPIIVHLFLAATFGYFVFKKD